MGLGLGSLRWGGWDRVELLVYIHRVGEGVWIGIGVGKSKWWGGAGCVWVR